MAAPRNPRRPAGRHDRGPSSPRRSAARSRRPVEHVQSTQSRGWQAGQWRRHESQRSVPAAINGALAALVSCFIGLTTLGFLALIGWVLAAGRSSVGAMLDFVGYTWLASHLAPVSVETGTLWAPPLVLTAAAIWLSARSARSAVRRGGLAGPGDLVRFVVAGGLASGVLGLLVAALTATSAASVPEWAAFAGCAVVGATGLLVGALRAAGQWRAAISRIPGYLRADLRAALRVTGALGLAGIGLFLLSLLLHAAEVGDLLGALRAGLTGTTMIVVLSLLYLPTAAVWSVGYVSGVPVSLGAGAVVAPWHAATGALPALPVFAAVPAGESPWLLLGMLVPFAAGVLAGATRPKPLPLLALRALGARLRLAGICALLALLAGAFAHVSLGGRLSGMGPNPLLLSGAIFGWVFVGQQVGDSARQLARRRRGRRLEPAPPERTLVTVDS